MAQFQPRATIYTVLPVLATLVMAAGITFTWLRIREYKRPPKPFVPPPLAPPDNPDIPAPKVAKAAEGIEEPPKEGEPKAPEEGKAPTKEGEPKAPEEGKAPTKEGEPKAPKEGEEKGAPKKPDEEEKK